MNISDLRPHQPTLNASLILQAVAYSLPRYLTSIDEELSLLTGHSHQYIGAAPATIDRPSRPMEGKCTGPRLVYEPDLAYIVDCGRPRPCPEHDDPVKLTPTEAAAQRRSELKANRDDAIQVIATITKLGLELQNHINRRTPPLAIAQPMCRDGQTGKDGTIEWGDATCPDAAAKAGLCGRHYWGWYRWRKRNGIDTSRMFEPSGMQPTDRRG